MESVKLVFPGMGQQETHAASSASSEEAAGHWEMGTAGRDRRNTPMVKDSCCSCDTPAICVTLDNSRSLPKLSQLIYELGLARTIIYTHSMTMVKYKVACICVQRFSRLL